jgi:hypothetical protein
MTDPKGVKMAPDGAGITTENIIGVTMEDLPVKDRDELECEQQQEIEAEVEERRKKKLACFQKTRCGVVKKGDTTRASQPVSSPFNLEELVHMIDVSVNSKYGVDLERITCTLTNSLHSSLETFKLEYKQDIDNSLGEGMGKRR